MKEKVTLKQMVEDLLNIAEEMCWNKISKNTTFAITLDNEKEWKPWKEKIKAKRKLLKEITEIPFNNAVAFLKKKKLDIYLIELYILKALKNKTIIEIRIRYKNQLDKTYINNISTELPLKHCKIAIPPYIKNKSQKFDINWEFGSLEYKIQMFLWKRRKNKRQ
ncbi:hypothetical protein [Aureispira sp. CCB-QB1]|uniref:hypothetical protein n=1 Tax=Aureispira sp. CCB-QB1 TaxID=1313421 RepID=UPI0006967E55|nr:hypothetical protein [Aureispira sp. CCB-QB1]